MEKKILLEVNRMRSMMGLRLITEGNIFTESINIWKSLFTKSAADLSVEEREILEKMIKKADEATQLFSEAGVRSVDELMSPAGKEVLRRALRETQTEIVDAMRRSVDDFYAVSVKNILDTTDDAFRTAINKKKIGSVGTPLFIVQQVAKGNIEEFPKDVLSLTIAQLNDIKLKGNLTDVQKKYIDDITNEISDNLKSRRQDFTMQAKEAAGETAAEKATREAEEALKKGREERAAEQDRLMRENAEIGQLETFFRGDPMFNQLTADQQESIINSIRLLKQQGKTNAQIQNELEALTLDWYNKAQIIARNNGQDKVAETLEKTANRVKSTNKLAKGLIPWIIGGLLLSGYTIKGLLGYGWAITGFGDDDNEEPTTDDDSSGGGSLGPDDY